MSNDLRKVFCAVSRLIQHVLILQNNFKIIFFSFLLSTDSDFIV